MHIKIPHKSSKSAAKQNIEKALNEGRSQLADKVEIHEEKWEGDTLNFDFTAQGQRITGTLEISDSDYVLDAKLPFMLRMFEGRIEKEIASRVKELGA